MSSSRNRGVALDVAFKTTLNKDLSSTVTDPAKCCPAKLNELWMPGRERVCVEAKEPCAQPPHDVSCKKEDEKLHTSEVAHVIPLTKQRCTRTQMALVWATLIALLLMIDYFILRSK